MSLPLAKPRDKSRRQAASGEGKRRRTNDGRKKHGYWKKINGLLTMRGEGCYGPVRFRNVGGRKRAQLSHNPRVQQLSRGKKAQYLDSREGGVKGGGGGLTEKFEEEKH